MSDRETTGRVLQQIPYGLYVVGSLNGTVPSTIVANWVTQVSFSPPWVAMAVEADSRMREYIRRSGLFSVNILPAGAREMAKAFLKGPEAAGGMIGGKRYEQAKNGTPFLVEASASFECRVMQTLEVPDHQVFVGEVVDAVLRREGTDVLTLRETGWHYSR
ncbi:MAG TPA: flavin reductase family protein [Bacteroidota bacterium]|nr:flavin reductase family protein [Bacteroidota bacterium]